MDFTIGQEQSFSGVHDANRRSYKKVIGKSGRIWLYAVQPNSADNIYVSASPNELQAGYNGFQGFGGQVLKFRLDDESFIELKAPWKSNADSLLEDTGVDLRDKFVTFGVVGRDCSVTANGREIIRDIVYIDELITIGEFDRIEKIAQQIANELHKSVAYYSRSHGGSTQGWKAPETRK